MAAKAKQAAVAEDIEESGDGDGEQAA